MKVENIIKEEYLGKLENSTLYNLSEASPSAKFYNELYALSAPEKGEKKALPELYLDLKAAHKKDGTAYKIMEEVVSLLESNLNKDAIVIEIGGGVHQQRSANASARFENYFPLDISYSNMKNYCDKFNKVGFVADAKKLPFKDNSVDCIFSHTFLEHPLAPEKVLLEIIRVLKVGGIVIHNDAWFCRWWQKYGVIGLKKFENMTVRERLLYVAYKVSEFPLIRIPPIVIKRLFNEIFKSKTQKSTLNYKKLEPNYELLLACDEDAANSLDPMEVVRFYESRGFSTLHPLTLKERLFYPNKYITLKKISI